MTADENVTSSRSPSEERAEGLSQVQPPHASVGGAWDTARGVVESYDSAVLARHAELVAVDNVIGLEATVARLEYDLRRARTRVKRLRELLEDRDEELTALRNSRTWKVGRLFTRPLGRLKG